MFDSVVVVTAWRVLAGQIRATIKQFAQVGETVGRAEHSVDLRRFIEAGKRIIVTTVREFPFVLGEIDDYNRGQAFAVVIDEAHSGQGGKTSAAVGDADPEDSPDPRTR